MSTDYILAGIASIITAWHLPTANTTFVLLSNCCTQPLQQLLNTLKTISTMDATPLRVPGWRASSHWPSPQQPVLTPLLNSVDSPLYAVRKTSLYFQALLLAKYLFLVLWQSWFHFKKVIYFLLSTNLNQWLIPQATGWRIPLAKLPSCIFSSTYSFFHVHLILFMNYTWNLV